MKLKLDENLPESLLTELVALGHDADNVRQEGLAGHSDPDAGRLELTRRVAEVFDQEWVSAWAGCFVVLSEHKLRVLLPPGCFCPHERLGWCRF